MARDVLDSILYYPAGTGWYRILNSLSGRNRIVLLLEISSSRTSDNIRAVVATATFRCKSQHCNVKCDLTSSSAYYYHASVFYGAFYKCDHYYYYYCIISTLSLVLDIKSPP